MTIGTFAITVSLSDTLYRKLDDGTLESICDDSSDIVGDCTDAIINKLTESVRLAFPTLDTESIRASIHVTVC